MELTDGIRKEWDFLKPLKSTFKFKRVLSTTVDSEGNIYITGFIQDDQKRDYNSFLGKYTSNGQELWLKPVSTSHAVIARSLATDSQGNACITGYNWGTSTVGDHKDDRDIYVAKYSGSDGRQEWFDTLGTKTLDEGFGIATDSTDNVYITGYTRGELKKDAHKGAEDVFLARYSRDGRQEWRDQLGTRVSDVGLGITTDPAGNVYITGFTQEHLKKNSYKGGEDIFLARYSSGGKRVWLEQLGTKASDLGLATAADRFGNVYVTGYTLGDFQHDTNNKKGPRSVFLARYYSGNGKKQGPEEQLCFPGNAEAKGITTDSTGNVYITGYIWTKTHNGYNKIDIFLARFSRNRERKCVILDTPWCDEPRGAAIDSKGNVYFAGVTKYEIEEAKKGNIILAKYHDD